MSAHPRSDGSAGTAVGTAAPADPDRGVDAVHDGESQGMRPLGPLAEGATTAVSRGIAVTGETMGLWQELLGIAVGSSDIAPAKGDRRFADPAWLQNPAFHRLGQSYLAFSATLGRLVDAFDSDPANWRQAEKRAGTWWQEWGTGASGIRAASVLPRSSRAARSTRRWIRPQAVM